MASPVPCVHLCTRGGVWLRRPLRRAVRASPRGFSRTAWPGENDHRGGLFRRPRRRGHSRERNRRTGWRRHARRPALGCCHRYPAGPLRSRRQHRAGRSFCDRSSDQISRLASSRLEWARGSTGRRRHERIDPRALGWTVSNRRPLTGAAGLCHLRQRLGPPDDAGSPGLGPERRGHEEPRVRAIEEDARRRDGTDRTGLRRTTPLHLLHRHLAGRTRSAHGGAALSRPTTTA